MTSFSRIPDGQEKEISLKGDSAEPSKQAIIMRMQALFKQGYECVERHELERAETCLEEAMDLYKTHGFLHEIFSQKLVLRMLYTLYSKTGNMEKLFPVSIRLFDMYMKEGNKQDALEAGQTMFNTLNVKAEETEKLFPVSVRLLDLLIKEGRITDALKLGHTAWLKFPKNHRIQQMLEPVAAGDEYPENVVIEVTVRCNLKCPGCEGRGDGKSLMPLDKYRRLIEELRGKVDNVILHNLGESMLHPDIIEMMRIAADAGLKPHIDTNGSVKMDHEGIVRSGLQSITFALDGLDQESYQQYRVNGKLDLVKQNIRELAAAKKRMNSAFPIITAKFIVMKTNEHQRDEVVETARELGADQVQVTQFSALGNPGNDPAHIAKFRPSSQRDFKHHQAAVEERKAFNPVLTSCPVVSISGPVVRWDGHVVPCCNDSFSSVRYGNAFDEGGFYEAWNNPKAKAFRVQAVLNAQKHKLCSNCFWADVPVENQAQLKHGLPVTTKTIPL